VALRKPVACRGWMPARVQGSTLTTDPTLCSGGAGGGGGGSSGVDGGKGGSVGTVGGGRGGVGVGGVWGVGGGGGGGGRGSVGDEKLGEKFSILSANDELASSSTIAKDERVPAARDELPPPPAAGPPSANKEKELARPPAARDELPPPPPPPPPAMPPAANKELASLPVAITSLLSPATFVSSSSSSSLLNSPASITKSLRGISTSKPERRNGSGVYLTNKVKATARSIRDMQFRFRANNVEIVGRGSLKIEEER
jgi:hypothetical protein